MQIAPVLYLTAVPDHIDYRVYLESIGDVPLICRTVRHLSDCGISHLWILCHYEHQAADLRRLHFDIDTTFLVKHGVSETKALAEACDSIEAQSLATITIASVFSPTGL